MDRGAWWAKVRGVAKHSTQHMGKAKAPPQTMNRTTRHNAGKEAQEEGHGQAGAWVREEDSALLSVIETSAVPCPDLFFWLKDI